MKVKVDITDINAEFMKWVSEGEGCSVKQFASNVLNDALLLCRYSVEQTIKGHDVGDLPKWLLMEDPQVVYMDTRNLE